MRNLRLFAFAALLITVLIGSYLTLRSLGLLGVPAAAQVRPVPAGDQEIVLLAPATSGETWERLVAAVRTLVQDWPAVYPSVPALTASYDKAFLNLTADTPELSLALGNGGKLWIRWYKLSSESTPQTWVENLTQRSPPPLAIIGGDTSERANQIAKVLEAQRGKWRGADPLFLITTATADRVFPPAFADPNPKDPDVYPKLTDVYKGATFRFSFTNSLMADAVLAFVQSQAGVWTQPHVLAGLAVSPAAPTALTVLPALWPPVALFTATWEDDPYSRDLTERFSRVFRKTFLPHDPGGRESDPKKLFMYSTSITYSVGDFSQPNHAEFLAVRSFLEWHRADRNQLVVLPTSAQRARRFLRDLYRRDPDKSRNLVVVSGDSISINNIYRDGEVVWNYLDLPFPLVFFSHRNPVDEAAGFQRKSAETGRPSKTGTQDLLLYRDIIEALLHAGYEKQVLLGDASRLKERLRAIHWRKGRVYHPDLFAAAAADVFPRPGDPLFDDEGNRRLGTGERIVHLRPEPAGPSARITFWRRLLDPAGRASWLMAGKTLNL